MTGAYFLFGIALVALGVGLARSLSTRALATAGIALLFLAALGTAAAGLFPVDVGAPRPITPEGWVHRIAAIIAFASMTIGPPRQRANDIAFTLRAFGLCPSGHPPLFRFLRVALQTDSLHVEVGVRRWRPAS